MSLPGTIMAALYLLIGIGIAWSDHRQRGGDFISLRGMVTALATAPSQATFGVLLRHLGVPRPDWQRLGLRGWAEVGFHLLATATLVYLLGFGLSLLWR